MKRSLSKNEKKFLIVGIPLINVDILLLIDFYIVGTVIGFSVLTIFSIGMLRKDNFSIQFSKLWIILFFIFVLMNPQPKYLINQLSRRWMNNRTQLIEPDHYSLPAVNASFQRWYIDEFGISFQDETDFETKVRSVDEFMRNIIFQYTLDQYNYGGVYDHLPSLDEIIASNDTNGKLHDDCDGISLYTASFLIFLGYEHVYIEEVTYHYHVMVFQEGDDPKTPEGYLNGISLYKGRVLAENDKQGYYMFNQTELFIPATRPLIKSIGEILTDGNVWKYDITELFSGELFGLPDIIGKTTSYILMYTVVFLISWIIALGLTFIILAGISDNIIRKFREKNGLKYSLGISVIIYISLLIGNILANLALNGLADFTFLCNPILIVCLITSLVLLNNKLFKL